MYTCVRRLQSGLQSKDPVVKRTSIADGGYMSAISQNTGRLQKRKQEQRSTKLDPADRTRTQVQDWLLSCCGRFSSKTYKGFGLRRSAIRYTYNNGDAMFLIKTLAILFKKNTEYICAVVTYWSLNPGKEQKGSMKNGKVKKQKGRLENKWNGA